MTDQGKCILILQDKLDKLTAQNEILKHDLKTQEYFNIKLHDGNTLKEGYAKKMQMRSKAVQTNKPSSNAKSTQTDTLEHKKTKLRNQLRKDSAKPFSYSSRSASTLSSAPVLKNLN